MSVVQRQVPVSKELSEAVESIALIVEDTRRALKDGWQPTSDVPAILLAAVQRLGVGLLGIQAIPQELRDDRRAAAYAVVLPLLDLLMLVTEPYSVESL